MISHIFTGIPRVSYKLLTRIILYLPVLSLECYECTNSPGFTGVSTCDSDEVTKRTCDANANRCMTVTFNFTLLTSQIVETKNCSNSLACDPDFPFNCKYLLAPFFYIPVVMYSQIVCTGRHQTLKSKTEEPLKVLSSSGIRGSKFISVYNFPAQ